MCFSMTQKGSISKFPMGESQQVLFYRKSIRRGQTVPHIKAAIWYMYMILISNNFDILSNYNYIFLL